MTAEQKFQHDYEYRIHRLRHFAKKYGWKEESFYHGVIDFSNDKKRLSIVIEVELTIISTLNHHKSGKTILSRKGIFTQAIVESIFRNPRQHMKIKIVKSQYMK